MLPSHKPYFIAETAFHHEGNTEFLLDLIESIKDLNVDAIKFHLLFEITDYMVASHPAVEVLNNISIPKDDWSKILLKAKSYNKDLVLLCNDVESAKWVISKQKELQPAALEIHSTGLNDIFLLKEVLGFEGTIILGSGGSSFDEVQFALNYLKSNGKTDLFLMHGFQNYPTDYKEINLKRMELLNTAFGVPVGYADHTDPADQKNAMISVLPQVMGFNVLEKHVTHVFGEKRIDAQAAISIDTMSEIIDLAQAVFAAKGEETYQLSENEKAYGNTGPLKKGIVARKEIKAGEIIDLDKVAFKRTETQSSLKQKDLSLLLGSKASRDIEKDELLSFSNVEYSFKTEDFSSFFVSKK